MRSGSPLASPRLKIPLREQHPEAVVAIGKCRRWAEGRATDTARHRSCRRRVERDSRERLLTAGHEEQPLLVDTSLSLSGHPPGDGAHSKQDNDVQTRARYKSRCLKCRTEDQAGRPDPPHPCASAEAARQETPAGQDVLSALRGEAASTSVPATGRRQGQRMAECSESRWSSANWRMRHGGSRSGASSPLHPVVDRVPRSRREHRAHSRCSADQWPPPMVPPAQPPHAARGRIQLGPAGPAARRPLPRLGVALPAPARRSPAPARSARGSCPWRCRGVRPRAEPRWWSCL